MDFSHILVQAIMTALCSKLLTRGYEVLIRCRLSIIKASSKQQWLKLLISTSPPVILDSKIMVDSVGDQGIILLPNVTLHPVQPTQMPGLDTLIPTQQTPSDLPISLVFLYGQLIQEAFTPGNVSDNCLHIEAILKLHLNRLDES